jgi:hypothetical protein
MAAVTIRNISDETHHAQERAVVRRPKFVTFLKPLFVHLDA